MDDTTFAFDGPPTKGEPRRFPRTRMDALTTLRDAQPIFMQGTISGWVALRSGRMTPDGVPLLVDPDPIPRLPENALWGYYIYTDMLHKDGHVGGLWRKLETSVLQYPQDVVPAGDLPDQMRRADGVREILARTPRWDDFITQMLKFRFIGRMAVEPVWEMGPRGVGIVDLRDCAPQEIIFDTAGRPWFVPYPLADPQPILPGGLILARREATRLNPFGAGLGRAIYFLYWLKREGVLKAWAFYNEKFGFPTVLGGYVPEVQEGEAAEFEANLLSMSQNAVFTYDKSRFEVSLMEAQRTGAVTTFKDFGDFINLEESKALFGETLTTQPMERGTTGAAGVHQDIFESAVRSLAKDVSTVIAQQLIPWIEYYNFGPPADGKYCGWRIEADPEIDVLTHLKTVANALDVGIPVPLRWAREQAGIPELEKINGVEEERLEAPATPVKEEPVPAQLPVTMAAPARLPSSLDQQEAQIRKVETAGAEAIAQELDVLTRNIMGKVSPRP